MPSVREHKVSSGIELATVTQALILADPSSAREYESTLWNSVGHLLLHNFRVAWLWRFEHCSCVKFWGWKLQSLEYIWTCSTFWCCNNVYVEWEATADSYRRLKRSLCAFLQCQARLFDPEVEGLTSQKRWFSSNATLRTPNLSLLVARNIFDSDNKTAEFIWYEVRR